MRVPHRQLENARRDPVAFRAAMAAKRGGGGITRFQLVQFAVKVYHLEGLDRAVRYLEDKFTNNDFRELDRYRDYLLDYDVAFAARPAIWYHINDKVELNLGHGVVLSGGLGRLDLCAGTIGHEAWLFEENVEPNWAAALRMPLLQGYLAEQVGARPEEVAVGIYSFRAANYYSVRFSRLEVEHAFQEADGLARLLTAP
ncbi:MAG: hypothetical protein ACM3UP_02040 [Methanocella sp.]